MLVDLLDQSIIAMKEIYELEKSSNDVQKQEKNDKIFSNVVSENHLMVKAVTDSMSQLGFVISQETRGKVIGLLKSSCDAVSRGLIQESTANYLQKEVFTIKKAILQEWSDYYHRVADQKINMLQTIKGIAPELTGVIDGPFAGIMITPPRSGEKAFQWFLPCSNAANRIDGTIRPDAERLC